MNERSLFFGKSISECLPWKQAIPVLIMLVVVPFLDPAGPTNELAIAFCQGGVLSAYSVFALYLLFGFLSDENWSPNRAADTGRVITLWLMAGISVACLF